MSKKQEQPKVPAVIAERGISAEQYQTLRNVTYPGAKDDNIIALAIDWHKATGRDVISNNCMAIVPMWDGKQRKYVEKLWPTINHVRTTASRTGQYIGKDAPVFGEDITEEFYDADLKSKIKLTYPEYCEVTVYKMVAGQKYPFTERVYWKETYASKKGGCPNAMWSGRPKGQLAKCAEAAALRTAFPEEVGSHHTEDEMYGKNLYDAEPIHQQEVEEPTIDPVVEKAKARKERQAEPVDAEYKEVEEPKFSITLPEGDDAVIGEFDAIDGAFEALYTHVRAIGSKEERKEAVMLNLDFLNTLDSNDMGDCVVELQKLYEGDDAN